MSHNHQKKVAVINDFSGFGRCSLTVALPILSAMQIQCCPIPTAIFSNHTGFPSYYWTDFTPHIEAYIKEWEKLDLRFEAIETGFLGSVQQIQVIESFLTRFASPKTVVVIDPVMGDYGKLYATYTQELAESMRKLTKHADILTPNLTEACILTNTNYHETITQPELTRMCETLCAQGPEKIVITSVPYDDNHIGNFVYVKDCRCEMQIQERIRPYRSGTGDIFSAILTGDAVHGKDFFASVRRASQFVAKAMRYTLQQDIPNTDGLCFEQFLYELCDKKSDLI